MSNEELWGQRRGCCLLFEWIRKGGRFLRFRCDCETKKVTYLPTWQGRYKCTYGAVFLAHKAGSCNDVSNAVPHGTHRSLAGWTLCVVDCLIWSSEKLSWTNIHLTKEKNKQLRIRYLIESQHKCLIERWDNIALDLVCEMYLTFLHKFSSNLQAQKNQW